MMCRQAGLCLSPVEKSHEREGRTHLPKIREMTLRPLKNPFALNAIGGEADAARWPSGTKLNKGSRKEDCEQGEAAIQSFKGFSAPLTKM
jgi:hypothetical protein